MRFKTFAGINAIELQIHKEEAIDLIQERYRLPADVAKRIVASAKNIDQAYSIAELMR
jgi:hypothetical protein